MHESAPELCGWTLAIHYTVGSSKTCFAERKLFNTSVLLLNSLHRCQSEKCILFVQIIQESLKVPVEERAITGSQPNFPLFSWTGLWLSPVNQFLLFCKATTVTPMAGMPCSMKERNQVSDSMATPHNSKTSLLFQAWYDYQDSPSDAHNFITNLLSMSVLAYQLSQRSMKSKTPTFLSSPLC